MQYQNPFAVDLRAAIDVFFQQLRAIQRWTCWDEREHRELLRNREADLNELWNDLMALAQNGGWNQIPTLMTGLMKNYAEIVALRQYLRADIDAWTLSEQTPGLRYSVAEKLAQKCDQQSALLFMALQQEDQRRQAEQMQSGTRLAETRITAAEQMLTTEFNRNQQLYERANNLLTQREQYLRAESLEVRNANADSRESLRVAINATREAGEIGNNLARQAGDFMARTQEYADYNSPAAVAREVNRRRLASKFTCVIVAGIIVVVLLGLVYFGLQHLY